MIEQTMPYIANTISIILLAYLGIKLTRKTGRKKRAGYSLLFIGASLMVSSLFTYYQFYSTEYWIIPETLLLIGFGSLTHSMLWWKVKK